MSTKIHDVRYEKFVWFYNVLEGGTSNLIYKAIFQLFVLYGYKMHPCIALEEHLLQEPEKI